MKRHEYLLIILGILLLILTLNVKAIVARDRSANELLTVSERLVEIDKKCRGQAGSPKHGGWIVGCKP